MRVTQATTIEAQVVGANTMGQAAVVNKRAFEPMNITVQPSLFCIPVQRQESGHEHASLGNRRAFLDDNSVIHCPCCTAQAQQHP